MPPDPPAALTAEDQKLLADAHIALGRLDGSEQILPNPDIFVAMYVRQEAVFSSQIEGTQSSLIDVLQFETEAGRRVPKDVEEVVNYIRAMNYGLQRLQSFPLSLRLLREIHAELMKGVRGSERTPGEFRRSQNWIGPAGCTLATATFVPPPPHEMMTALGDLEAFLHEPKGSPALVHCGLAHAQFETIHPFLDGNGRLGRLLITFLLCRHGVLQRPLLYLSHYLKRNREEYYDRLTAIREHGNWEGWIRFFLRGVLEVSHQATATARKILAMRKQHESLVAEKGGRTTKGMAFLDLLFQSPLTTVRRACDGLGCSYPTANALVNRFEQFGLLVEITGQKRNRIFRYAPYLNLFPKS